MVGVGVGFGVGFLVFFGFGGGGAYGAWPVAGASPSTLAAGGKVSEGCPSSTADMIARQV